MITYNKSKEVFSSNIKEHNISTVSDVMMYQWVKTGEISLPDFKAWFIWKMKQASTK